VRTFVLLEQEFVPRDSGPLIILLVVLVAVAARPRLVWQESSGLGYYVRSLEPISLLERAIESALPQIRT
jgi:hypothetical protein